MVRDKRSRSPTDIGLASEATLHGVANPSAWSRGRGKAALHEYPSVSLDSGGDGFGQVFAGAGRYDAGCFGWIG